MSRLDPRERFSGTVANYDALTEAACWRLAPAAG